MRPLHIRGGNILYPNGLAPGDLWIEDGALTESAAGGQVLDATGLIVAPGLIDIHGDAFERQVMPRPGVFFPMDVAFLDTDRQLATNGITTAYHALTLSWEPGLRAVDRGRETLRALDQIKPRLTVDHRVQLRWETFCFEALDLIREAMAGPQRPALAFNDHTTMEMRPEEQRVTERPFDLHATHAAISLDSPVLRKRAQKQAARSGLSVEDYIALLGSVWERRQDVSKGIRDLGAEAARHAIPMLSHDDCQLETRAFYRSAGASIAEFPMREDVARDARERGEHVVLGAPNVVRGGSHIGSLNAADMIEAGLCTILASDYFYPALLTSAARLHNDRRAPLPEIWATVSTNPAEALGLTDRGRIAPGQRADLVLLEWPDGATPSVRATLSGGRIAHLDGDLLR